MIKKINFSQWVWIASWPFCHCYFTDEKTSYIETRQQELSELLFLSLYIATIVQNLKILKPRNFGQKTVEGESHYTWRAGLLICRERKNGLEPVLQLEDQRRISLKNKGVEREAKNKWDSQNWGNLFFFEETEGVQNMIAPQALFHRKLLKVPCHHQWNFTLLCSIKVT